MTTVMHEGAPPVIPLKERTQRARRLGNRNNVEGS